MFSLPDIAPITRVVNHDDVTWDSDNRVFVASDSNLDWHGEPVVLISPKTGETIRFDSLEIRLGLHTGDIDAWVLRGVGHEWELVIRARDEEC